MTSHREEVGARSNLAGICLIILGCSVMTDNVCFSLYKWCWLYTANIYIYIFNHRVAFSVICGCLNLETQVVEWWTACIHVCMCMAPTHRHKWRNTEVTGAFFSEIDAERLRRIKRFERTKVQENRYSNKPSDLWAMWRIYHTLASVHMINLLWSLTSDSPWELICKPEISEW